MTLFANHQPDSVYAMPPQALLQIAEGFFDHSLLAESIAGVLLEERDKLPVLARNGGFIRKGAYPPLDYLRDIRDESEKKMY